MPKIQNPKLYDIALQVGGSHYPDVGGELLEQYAVRVIKECCSIYDKIDNGNLHCDTDNYLEAVHKHFGLK